MKIKFFASLLISGFAQIAVADHSDLMKAIRLGDIKTTAELLKRSDQNRFEDGGRSALTQAIRSARKQPKINPIVKMLLDNGANPSLISTETSSQPGSDDSPYLTVFETFTDENAIQEYLKLFVDTKKEKLPPEKLDVQLAAAMKTRTDNDVSIDVQARKRLALFIELIASGANPNLPSPDGITPVIWAVEIGSWAFIHDPYSLAAMKIIPFLVKKGANLFPKTGQKDWASVLISNYDPDLALMRYLFRKGLDVNASDTDGDTMIMRSIRRDYGPAIELLLLYGPNLKLKNRKGETALTLAKDKKDILAKLKQAPVSALPVNEVLALATPDFKALNEMIVADLTEWRAIPNQLAALVMAKSPEGYYHAVLYLIKKDGTTLSIVDRFPLEANMDLCPQAISEPRVSGGELTLKFDKADYKLDETHTALGVHLSLVDNGGSGYGSSYEKLFAFQIETVKLTKVFEEYVSDVGRNPIEAARRKFVVVVGPEKANAHYVWSMLGGEIRYVKNHPIKKRLETRRFQWKEGTGYHSTEYKPAWKLSDPVGHCD